MEVMAKSKKTPVKIEKPIPAWLEKLNDIYFWEVLAFVIPFLLMGYAFKRAEMHPFGDRQFLVTDLWHQYYPFFHKIMRIVKHPVITLNIKAIHLI